MADLKFPKIGNLAPDFTLLNQDGEKVNLKSFRGEKNVVLYFYPKAMTPGCTVQACGLRDKKRQLSAQDTVVLGVSPDPVSRLEKFREKENLNFDLLSDEDHKVAEKYGVWALKKNYGREYWGIVRTSFIIDQDGRLRHIMDKVKTKTHDDDVLNWIKENL
jgi:peroxiredoxin Q/BCP